MPQAPEDNEEEDFKILSADNLLIVGRADDEFSSVEVHGKVYALEVKPEHDLSAAGMHKVYITENCSLIISPKVFSNSYLTSLANLF